MIGMFYIHQKQIKECTVYQEIDTIAWVLNYEESIVTVIDKDQLLKTREEAEAKLRDVKR